MLDFVGGPGYSAAKNDLCDSILAVWTTRAEWFLLVLVMVFLEYRLREQKVRLWLVPTKFGDIAMVKCHGQVPLARGSLGMVPRIYGSYLGYDRFLSPANVLFRSTFFLFFFVAHSSPSQHLRTDTRRYISVPERV